MSRHLIQIKLNSAFLHSFFLTTYLLRSKFVSLNIFLHIISRAERGNVIARIIIDCCSSTAWHAIVLFARAFLTFIFYYTLLLNIYFLLPSMPMRRSITSMKLFLHVTFPHIVHCLSSTFIVADIKESSCDTPTQPHFFFFMWEIPFGC